MWLVSKNQLRWWYGRYNNLYFGGKLQKIRFGFNSRNTELGSVLHSNPPILFINNKLRWSRTLSKTTLLHEMIHVKLGHGPGHNKEFRKELRRLILKGAFDNLL